MIIQKLYLEDFDQIKILMNEYKISIGEETAAEEELICLKDAIINNQITFYVAKQDNKLIAMCSVCITYSTYNFSKGGIFEDFYIVPEYRKKGIARLLTDYVFKECENQNIRSLWVGCAGCDVQMYQSLGFETLLGNLLTWS